MANQFPGDLMLFLGFFLKSPGNCPKSQGKIKITLNPREIGENSLLNSSKQQTSKVETKQTIKTNQNVKQTQTRPQPSLPQKPNQNQKQ